MRKKKRDPSGDLSSKSCPGSLNTGIDLKKKNLSETRGGGGENPDLSSGKPVRRPRAKGEQKKKNLMIQNTPLYGYRKELRKSSNILGQNG